MKFLIPLFGVVIDDADEEVMEQPVMGVGDVQLPSFPRVDKGKGLVVDAPIMRCEPTGFMASVRYLGGHGFVRVEGPAVKVSSSFEGLDSCFLPKSLGPILVKTHDNIFS